MKTRYVYTEKAELLAKERNLETRKAGTPASFAYKPLEESPITKKAWLEGGFIEEIPEPINFLTFNWINDNSSANDNMKNIFKENNIKYFYQLGTLYADIEKNGRYKKIDCYHVEGDLFEIIEAPRTTAQYFDYTPEELYKKNSDGYSKEEVLLCDYNIDAQPFAETYKEALRKANHYKSIGCEGVEILERINHKYGVVCY